MILIEVTKIETASSMISISKMRREGKKKKRKGEGGCENNWKKKKEREKKNRNAEEDSWRKIKWKGLMSNSQI